MDDAATARASVTGLLRAHHQGDANAFNELFALVYQDLRRVARAQAARGGVDTLNATALVHEVYVRLVDCTQIDWQGRHHFFAVAARAMRRTLVDYARERRSQKRGGGRARADIDLDQLPADGEMDTLLLLGAALDRLAEFNPRLASVAECRLFAGLSEKETAEALDAPLRTVQREWARARAWLQQALQEPGAAGARR